MIKVMQQLIDVQDEEISILKNRLARKDALIEKMTALIDSQEMTINSQSEMLDRQHMLMVKTVEAHRAFEFAGCVDYAFDPRKEEAMEAHFYASLDTYLPEATKSGKLGRDNSQPDGFVTINGETLPVEVKREKFDQKALRQLQKYMCTFSASGGVAVARELTVRLPENVTFVKIDESMFEAYCTIEYAKASSSVANLYKKSNWELPKAFTEY